MGDRPRSRDEAKEHITSIRHRRGMSEDGNGELARMNKEDLEAAIVLYLSFRLHSSVQTITYFNF